MTFIQKYHVSILENTSKANIHVTTTWGENRVSQPAIAPTSCSPVMTPNLSPRSKCYYDSDNNPSLPLNHIIRIILVYLLYLTQQNASEIHLYDCT